ncbi:MAG: 30S ribosomal protein S16 [candidate division WS6 bacterium OLB20]|uniref:Small ribosomal subunit protein bS16 n=1 Tax=candidate division WS6 bacterium OLB20 TaxID=1617426 RepID=A0A136LY69_9BACT|nr:MAG: 30S ribosomal protein S16 [candidate division WS6 bacterium OLB20]
MVKLRLTRTGKKHAPQYRIIAISARTKRDGKALEILGHYNPMTKPSTIVINKDRVKYWLENGAQPTDTVANMLVKEGILPKPADKKQFSKQPGRKKQEREQAKAAAAKTEQPAEAAAE